jgi:hypothetical protein
MTKSVREKQMVKSSHVYRMRGMMSGVTSTDEGETIEVSVGVVS